MIRIARIFVSLLSWTLFTSSLAAQDLLAWKFTPGETSNYQLIQKTKTTINLGNSTTTESGDGVTTEVHQTLDLAWMVKELKNDKTALVELDITRIQMKIDGPGGQSLQYDSAAEERPQGFAAMIAGFLKSLSDAAFQMTITPRGEITSVVLPESLLEEARNAPGGELMGGLTSEAGFKNLMSQNTLLLPELANLAAGYEWTNTSTIENPAMGGKQTVETTYIYAGIEQSDGQLFDAFTINMVFGFGNGKMPGGANIHILQQQSTGKILFNRAAGRLESSTIEQRMQLGIETDGQKIEQAIEQTVNFQWLEE